MTQSASNSFNGYQINSRTLVLHGTIDNSDIREIVGVEDLSSIVKLKLIGCNANRLDLGILKERLVKLDSIKIVEMKLNSTLLNLLQHSNVTRLTFKQCTAPFAYKAFSSLVGFKNLACVDIRDANLSSIEKSMLSEHTSTIRVISPRIPMPWFGDNEIGVEIVRQENNCPPTPHANRTKRPRFL